MWYVLVQTGKRVFEWEIYFVGWKGVVEGLVMSMLRSLQRGYALLEWTVDIEG